MSAAIVASAPGKLILAGEYAVLAGHPALVAAVDRRVHGRYQPGAADRGARSPFVRAAQHALATRFGRDDLSVRALGAAAFDSSALANVAGDKLGLGSSAAVTAAAIALGFAARGTAPAPDELLALALAAHGDAQATLGERGSGADVAAACFGGLLRYRAGIAPNRPEIQPARWPTGLRAVFVFTGRSASTPKLVSQVRAYAAADARGHTAHLAAIAEAAEALATATGPAAALAAIGAGQVAVAALGRAAGAAIETDEIRELVALAAAHHGAAKSTGAGGGDVVLAAFADAPAAARFSAALPPRLPALKLALDFQGASAGPEDPALVRSIAGD